MAEAGPFAERFKKRFMASPDVPAFQAYDAVSLLAKAIQARGLKTEALMEYLSSFGEYQGVSGTLRTARGQVQFPLDFYIVRGEGYRRVK
jgi:ABC-type branched-subunit amino acid transport system substrate-binding protein